MPLPATPPHPAHPTLTLPAVWPQLPLEHQTRLAQLLAGLVRRIRTRPVGEDPYDEHC